MNSPDPLAPTIPGFEILRRTSEGAQGAVYRARDRDLGRVVALKVLKEFTGDPGIRGRFAREARILVRHPHPNLVPLLDAQLDGSPPYLVFRWMGGGDLEGALAARGRFAEEEVLRVATRVGEALEHLHRFEVLHRDIKPSNLLLDDRGEVHLADLGLGLVRGAPELTRTGRIVGTLRYIAPETLVHHEYSPRSDLFGLATVLLEMGLGRKVDRFTDLSPRALRAHPLAWGPRLRDAVLRSLAEDPANRPADLREFLDALAEPAAAPRSPRPAPAPSPRPPDARRGGQPREPRPRLLAGIAAVLVLAMFLAGFAAGTRRPATLPPAATPEPPDPFRGLRAAVARLRPDRGDPPETDAPVAVIAPWTEPLLAPTYALRWARVLEGVPQVAPEDPASDHAWAHEFLPALQAELRDFDRVARLIRAKLQEFPITPEAGVLAPRLEAWNTRRAELRDAFRALAVDPGGGGPRRSLPAEILLADASWALEMPGTSPIPRALLARLGEAAATPYFAAAFLALEGAGADARRAGSATCAELRELHRAMGAAVLRELARARDAGNEPRLTPRYLWERASALRACGLPTDPADLAHIRELAAAFGAARDIFPEGVLTNLLGAHLLLRKSLPGGARPAGHLALAELLGELSRCADPGCARGVLARAGPPSPRGPGG